MKNIKTMVAKKLKARAGMGDSFCRRIVETIAPNTCDTAPMNIPIIIAPMKFPGGEELLFDIAHQR